MRQLLLTHIRKIKNNKQIFIILFLLSPIIIAATNNPLLVFFPYLVSMHLFSGITKVERKEGIKQGEDILLNSLPVSRKEIVISRYLIILFFGLLTISTFLGFSFIISFLVKNPFQISSIFFINFFIIQFMYNIFFIPLEYLSSAKAQIIKGLVYMGVIFVFSGIKKLNIYVLNFLNTFKENSFYVMIFIGVIILSIPVSIFLSIKIYEKKEF